jgi:putative transposase
VAGYSLHADTTIPAGASDELERLLRYAGRPALAEERLSELPDGRLVYRLKRPWRDGTCSVVFTPADLMGRLAALVPPPRAHAIHYYGVFAPGAAYRPAIVPGASEPAEVSATETSTEAIDKTHRAITPRPRNYSWSSLMRRIFAIDVLVCPACAGPMKIIAAITQPEIASRILGCLGLPCRAPPLSPAREQTNHHPPTAP